MSGQPILPITAELLPGDFGREYIRVTIGDVEITVYQSEARPGGVTVEIDGEDQDLLILSVNVNDWEVYPSA